MQQYSTARINLKKGIRDAKTTYRQKIENHFTNLDRQGIHHITGQNNSSSLSHSSASEAEQLNQFFSHFGVKRTGTTISQASAENSQTFVIQPAEVIRTLHKSTHGKQLVRMSSWGASSETVLQSWVRYLQIYSTFLC